MKILDLFKYIIVFFSFILGFKLSSSKQKTKQLEQDVKDLQLKNETEKNNSKLNRRQLIDGL